MFTILCQGASIVSHSAVVVLLAPSSLDPFFSASDESACTYTKKWQYEILPRSRLFVCVMTLPVCATLFSLPPFCTQHFQQNSLFLSLPALWWSCDNTKRSKTFNAMMSHNLIQTLCRTWEKSFFVFIRQHCWELLRFARRSRWWFREHFTVNRRKCFL
jgi:hypothetical protein